MSELTHPTTDRRLVVNGAKVGVKQPQEKRREPPPGAYEREIEAQRSHPDAYVLARANQHKPWARRWLKEHGVWL